MRINIPRAVVGSLVVGLLAIQSVHAQNNDPWRDRYGRDGRYDAYTRLARVEAGTYVTVRVSQSIETNRREDRAFPAVVEEDVWDNYNRLAVPAIPRGSPAELRVRAAADGDLILDLDSIIVDGRRYVVDAQATRLEARPRGTSGDEAAEYVGGGALLGTIIGAIAGGGKGAAIGAAAGAGIGAAGLVTRGREVRVPAGSRLTFRLDRDLAFGGRSDRR
ncbi:MAG TPA: hypothetical protein VEU08_02785 [Vicinamibacterales bacterium]|nr:hypothetical protein [Vicinamibacterales bacterium]